MPKNKGKGGKNRKRGKNENEEEKRELVYKEDGQEYAQVRQSGAAEAARSFERVGGCVRLGAASGRQRAPGLMLCYANATGASWGGV